MGHGKETPRQKMIGMMYLFYTALLALNVSAEVLSAFQLVDKSLRNSNNNTADVIAQKQNEFVKAMVNDSMGVAPFKALADEVIMKADASYDLIQYYKGLLVTKLEGQTPELNDTIEPDAFKNLITKVVTDSKPEEVAGLDNLFSANEVNLNKFYPVGEYCIEELLSKKDDTNVGGQIFVSDPSQGRQGRGDFIKGSLAEFRDFLVDFLSNNQTINKVATETAKAERQSLIENVKSTLAVDTKIKSGNADADSVDWVSANFEHLPAAGVITLMSKMQADVRNLEASMLTYLLEQIGKSDMKFNAIKAVVNAPKSYISQGETFKAEVFIAAYDSTENPEILVGNSPIKVENGVGTFTAQGNAVGVHTWGGVIKLKNKSTGEIKEYPFKSEYEVGVASVSVSPTKMNVFYIGVDNPVDITASGVPSEKLQASITGGGSITRKSGSNFIVRVKQPGNVKVHVSYNQDGSTKSFPAKEFRVKRVPDPVACVGSDPATKRGNCAISKSILSAQSGVKAELENFDFDLKFTVTGFTISAKIKGFDKEETSHNSAFTAAQRQLIQQVSPGSKIYIEDVKAKGPDGSIRQ